MKKEKTKEISENFSKKGRGDVAYPWELEMLSPEEQMDRAIELLTRGIYRLIKRQDKGQDIV